MKLLFSREWLERKIRELGEEPYCPHGFMVGCEVCAKKEERERERAENARLKF